MKAKALCLSLACVLFNVTPAHAHKELSGSLALGVAGHPAHEFGPGADSLCAQLKLHYVPAHCPFTFDLEERHMFFDDRNHYWPAKDKLVLGASVPIYPKVALFVNYERNYYGPKAADWYFSGVRLGF